MSQKLMTIPSLTPLDEDLLKSIHRLPIAEVYQVLATQLQGLSQAEADQRLQHFGRNVIHKVKGKSLWVKFLANFTHLMALLLWLGGLIAFAAQLPQLGLAIWLVNLINGLFSFWQEYRAEQATEALRQLMPTYARVLREGEERRILAEALVPGDVMLLSEGDRISADCRLVQEAELRVDQSTLTGESHPVRKTDEAVLRPDLAHIELPNLVFAGTNVAAGTARGVVFATGMKSEFGKIAHLTQSVTEEASPLQQELGQVTRVVSLIAVASGLVFFALAWLLAGLNLAESFIFALGMIVAFVPEGLLPTVTLALAMGVQRMARRHALVKRLSAVETLGSATIICTDKTGTLTQNEMTVCDLWLAGQQLAVTGVGYTPEGQILPVGHSIPPPLKDDLHLLLIAACLCNNARLLPPNGDTSHWTALGDPTEAALLVAALKGGVDLETAARQTPRLRELPARIASQVFRVPRVVARVYDPYKAEVYQRLGLQTIAPTTWGINRIAELLSFFSLGTTISLGSGDVDILETEISPLLVGRTVNEVTVPDEVHVVAISRGGKTFLPTLGTVFQAGDWLHLAVLATSADRLKMLLGRD